MTRSGRKCKLLTAAERKLVRMVKSQPKTNRKQVCSELDAAQETGVSVHSHSPQCPFSCAVRSVEGGRAQMWSIAVMKQ